MACVIESERLLNSNNSIPIEQHTFQLAAVHLPASVGSQRASLKIAPVLGYYFNLRDWF
jgi:hypothetical protein